MCDYIIFTLLTIIIFVIIDSEIEQIMPEFPYYFSNRWHVMSETLLAF